MLKNSLSHTGNNIVRYDILSKIDKQRLTDVVGDDCVVHRYVNYEIWPVVVDGEFTEYLGNGVGAEPRADLLALGDAHTSCSVARARVREEGTAGTIGLLLRNIYAGVCIFIVCNIAEVNMNGNVYI